MPTQKLRPEQRLPGRDAGELLFRTLATVGKATGTHAAWIWDVVEQVKSLAQSRVAFSVDDLRARLEIMGIEEPADSRSYGTVFREAARLGYVENRGRTVKGKPRPHVGTPKTRPVTVWESLL